MRQRTTLLMTRRARMSVAAVLALGLLASACSASTTTITADSSAAVATSEPAVENTVVDDAPAEAAPVEEPPAEEPPGEDAPTDGGSASETPAEDTPDEAPVEEAPDDELTTEQQPGEVLGAGEASVELLDAGSEPRRELRFNIASTCGEVTELVQTQELEQVIDGVPSPSSGPIGTVTEMETSVTPNGDNYDIRAVVTRATSAPGTNPQVAVGLDASLTAMIGLTTISTITNRGIQVPGSARIEGAEALGDLEPLLDSLTQAQNPLPLEPVGLGGRWITRSVIELEGLLVETATTFELVSIEDTLITVAVTGEQFVEEGAVMNMQGLEANITLWDLESSGTVTMDLATISPISGLVESFGTQGFSVLGTELVQDVSTEIATTTVPNIGCTGRTTRP